MITAIGDVMRESYKRGWITTRDGNISLRRNDKFYITPSGIRKATIIPEILMKGKIDDASGTITILNSHAEPSIEQDMHKKIQLAGKKTQAVVHLHPTYTIALMYRIMRNYASGKAGLQAISDQFPELSRYTKVGYICEFQDPGTELLADAVFEAISTNGKVHYDIAGIDCHGVVAVGQHPWEAFEHIERLEHIAQIYLMSGV